MIVGAIMVAMRLKLSYIYTQVVNIVHSPYDVNFTKFESLRQPLINFGKINLPPYLKEEHTKEDFERRHKTLRTPNLHELLFWLGAPNFMIRIMHVTIVVQLLWTIWFSLDGYDNSKNAAQIILAVIAWIFTLANFFWLIPTNLRAFCTVTSVD